MSRPRGIGIQVLPLVLALAASCTGTTSPTTPSEPIPAVNATSAPSLPTTANALPSLDPAQFASLLAQLKGTPLVVNFWASWCTPCRSEAPLLRDAHAQYGHRVQFVGVDMQDARDGAERFIQEQGITYPSVFDPTNAIGLGYDLVSPPMTLFYDRAGTLVSTVPGELFDATLQKNLQAVSPTRE